MALRYNVRLKVLAEIDFEELDGSIQQKVSKQLKKLETSPYLGKPLGRKNNIDLTGCYKFYLYIAEDPSLNLS